MGKIIMQKIKALWQCVKACVKVCVDWVWQNRLSAFLVMVGVVLVAILFLVMFNECVEYWVKRALGIGRKRDAIQFIGWSIVGTFGFWVLVMGGRWGVPKIKNNMEKMKVIGWWIRKNPVDAFLLLIGLILLTVLFLVMFSDYVGCWAKDILGANDKKDAIQSVGLGFAGVLAVFGAIAVNRRAHAQIKDNELVEIGHIQERFKTAVEHLGNQHASVRIASFYEFSYLARDNEDLQRNILDILYAHLRQTTTNKGYKKEVEFIDEGDNSKVRPTEEVQSLLGVLFQPKRGLRNLVFIATNPNLRRVFLMTADLRRANLQGVHLFIADLRQADLRGADLREANLQNANLQNALLEGANLQDAYLSKTNLQGAKLKGANLQDANLNKVKLPFVVLKNENLQGVKLQDAKLKGANLRGTNLQRADLQRADLRDGDLQGANLCKTNFRGADLREVDFGDADLQEADLQEADLRDANLKETKNLGMADLRMVRIKNTKFPKGYEPPDDVIDDDVIDDDNDFPF